MKPYKYQETLALKAFNILSERGLVYLAMEERTGKTLTSLLIAEHYRAKRVLVITKKKALDGWNTTISAYKPGFSVAVINYESLKKLEGLEFDFAIIDEAHYGLSSYPKPSSTAKVVQKFVYSLPVVFLSATPSSQSYSQLFHQLNVSSNSPWGHYRNFYDWFRDYGKLKQLRLQGRLVNNYDDVKTELVKADVEPLVVTATRAELGFTQAPNDCVEYVELHSSLVDLMDRVWRDRCLPEHDYECPSSATALTAMHQIEGSTLKLKSKEPLFLAPSKALYLLERFGDTEDLAVFYNYIAEKALLSKYFKKALLLQSSAYAEGVDLSHIKFLVVYSMNFSASKFVQRRARQCNKNRVDPINVVYLLVKGGLSEKVYERVAVEKKNFTASYYEKSQ